MLKLARIQILCNKLENIFAIRVVLSKQTFAKIYINTVLDVTKNVDHISF